MRTKRSLKPLSKFLGYVLGRRPDEFGLVPNDKGYVKIKEMLQAIHEEEGWRHVRMSHIKELTLTLPAPPVQITERYIRATEQDHAPVWHPASNPPKLLYTCIRKRAYPHVLEKGLFPFRPDRVVLAAEPEMAIRIGTRKGSDPVLLTVQSQALLAAGGTLYECHGVLYLAPAIFPGCFTGPALPKEKQATLKDRGKPGDKRTAEAGSYAIKGFPEPSMRKNPMKKKRKDEIAWKKGRRQMKKVVRRR